VSAWVLYPLGHRFIDGGLGWTARADDVATGAANAVCIALWLLGSGRIGVGERIADKGRRGSLYWGRASTDASDRPAVQRDPRSSGRLDDDAIRGKGCGHS
jgi:hypothetical protein